MVATPTTPITQTPSPRKQNAELSSHFKSNDDADKFASQNTDGNADVITAQVQKCKPFSKLTVYNYISISELISRF